jgi:hypothetical protein
MPAGNLIGGLAYSHIHNLKITYYYQTKLRILIVYEKREDIRVKLPSWGQGWEKTRVFLKIDPPAGFWVGKWMCKWVSLRGVVVDLSGLRDRGPGFKTRSRPLTFMKADTNFRTLHVVGFSCTNEFYRIPSCKRRFNALN